MPLHAAFEIAQTGAIVELLFKFELSTVFHVLTELGWVPTTEFFKACLNLLFLDVVVLFVLGATWQSLPGQLTLYKVK